MSDEIFYTNIDEQTKRLDACSCPYGLYDASLLELGFKPTVRELRLTRSTKNQTRLDADVSYMDEDIEINKTVEVGSEPIALLAGHYSNSGIMASALMSHIKGFNYLAELSEFLMENPSIRGRYISTLEIGDVNFICVESPVGRRAVRVVDLRDIGGLTITDTSKDANEVDLYITYQEDGNHYMWDYTGPVEDAYSTLLSHYPESAALLFRLFGAAFGTNHHEEGGICSLETPQIEGDYRVTYQTEKAVLLTGLDFLAVLDRGGLGNVHTGEVIKPTMVGSDLVYAVRDAFGIRGNNLMLPFDTIQSYIDATPLPSRAATVEGSTLSWGHTTNDNLFGGSIIQTVTPKDGWWIKSVRSCETNQQWRINNEPK